MVRTALVPVCMLGVLVGACSSQPARPPAPPVAPGHLTARHFDQSCRSVGRPPAVVDVDELFDTTGLGRVLAEVGIKPLPLAPPWPLYSFVSHYDQWGRPVAMGTWDATVDDSIAVRLEGVLRERVRAIPGGLLEGAGFRSQVVFARRISFDLAPPVECMPHMYHAENQPPLGLPTGVATEGGGGRRVRDGDTLTAIVRIVVGPDGRVNRIEDQAGSPQALRRAREVVGLLRFDPALRNGVPVEGTLVQTFRFRGR